MIVLPAAVLLMTSPGEPPPCVVPAPGMRCVPATKLVVGDARSRREVSVEAFYADEKPLTPADVDACVTAGACPGGEAKGNRGGDATTVATLTWSMAEATCAFLGKRLPSEAEWEAAAALMQPVSPPPVQTPTTTPTPTPTTTPTPTPTPTPTTTPTPTPTTTPNPPSTSSSTALAEWTNTWMTDPAMCPKPSAVIEDFPVQFAVPPSVCGRDDRLDPCDGAFFCGHLTQKVLRKPGADARGARTGAAWAGPKKAAARCVTSTPWLARFPPLSRTVPRPTPPAPSPPTDQELAVFRGFEEDVLDTPLCEKVGRSFQNCRDPRSYLKTNEPRQEVVAPYITNLGGGYTGVGSDQNYTFVAAARSQWAWIFDYDPNVVNWHHVLRALVIASATRQEFVGRFLPAQLQSSAKIIRDAYAAEQDARTLEALFRSSFKQLLPHYQRESTQADRRFTWLGTDEAYAYVRLLFSQGRMRAFRGNMLDVHTMRGVAAAARKLGVAIRIYYPSNAPEFWRFDDVYRANVAALPFDDDSVVVQTISSMKTGFGQQGYWHYNVQDGHEQQRLLSRPGYLRLRQLMYHRTKSDSPELTISGLRSSPP